MRWAFSGPQQDHKGRGFSVISSFHMTGALARRRKRAMLGKCIGVLACDFASSENPHHITSNRVLRRLADHLPGRTHLKLPADHVVSERACGMDSTDSLASAGARLL